MTSYWRLTLVGLAAYVLFLVMTAPAAKLLPVLQPQMPQVQFSGISGSLWSGRAQLVRSGRVSLDDVRWRFRPLALFTAALEVGLEAQFIGQALRADAGVGAFSGPYVSDLSGSLPASEVLALAGVSVAQLQGQVTFDIDRVTGLGAGLPAVAGQVAWAPARVIAPLQLDLGKAQLQTRIESGVTRGNLVASGGALSLDGEVTFNPDGSYRLVGDAQKHGELPQAVDRFLATFAEYKDGKYRLEWSDKVKF